MSIVTIVHIIVSILLIIVVLLQQGKGADVGSTFGGGGSSVFGAAGADNLLTRFTAVVAFIFMFTSVMLAVRTQEKLSSDGELFSNVPAKTETAAKVEEEKKVEETTEQPIETDTAKTEAPSADGAAVPAE